MFDSQYQTFKAVEMKNSVGSLLEIPGHVVPMMLEIYVLSEKSKFFNIFISCNKILG